MRTDVHVAGKEVLAVVLADVESSLKFPVPTIRDSITTKTQRFNEQNLSEE